MAYTGAIDLGTREQLPDFVLYEVTSPNRWSRKSVPAVAGTNAGDAVDSTGALTTTAADVVGIALSSVGSETGLTSLGQIENTVLYRDAEVKDMGWATDIAAALEALGITIVPTGK